MPTSVSAVATAPALDARTAAGRSAVPAIVHLVLVAAVSGLAGCHAAAGTSAAAASASGASSPARTTPVRDAAPNADASGHATANPSANPPANASASLPGGIPTTPAELADAPASLVLGRRTVRLDARVISGPTPVNGQPGRPLRTEFRIVAVDGLGERVGSIARDRPDWRIDRFWVFSGPLVWTGADGLPPGPVDAFTASGGPAWRVGRPARVVVRVRDSSGRRLGLLAAAPGTIQLLEWRLD